MEYQGLSAYAELIPYRGRPAAVQSLEARPGSLETTLFWTAPQSMEGVDGWAVYKDNETNRVLQSDDVNLRQATIKMPANGQAMFYVCAVSKLGYEAPKIPVLASSNADSMVVTGTGGATAGTPAVPDPGWSQQPSGGGGGRRFTF